MTGVIARHFTVFYFKAVVVRHFRSRWDVDPCKKTNVVFTAGFDDFLAGFQIVDDHFRSAPLSENGPAIAGLLGIWYRNFWGWQTHAVLPYSQALDRFSAYLQQLDMESNGKRINLDGEPVQKKKLRFSIRPRHLRVAF